MIPWGQTRCIKILDKSINKPLKDQLKRKYINYLINQNSNKVSREKLMEWISEIWGGDNIISPNLVQNCFKVSS